MNFICCKESVHFFGTKPKIESLLCGDLNLTRIHIQLEKKNNLRLLNKSFQAIPQSLTYFRFCITDLNFRPFKNWEKRGKLKVYVRIFKNLVIEPFRIESPSLSRGDVLLCSSKLGNAVPFSSESIFFNSELRIRGPRSIILILIFLMRISKDL